MTRTEEEESVSIKEEVMSVDQVPPDMECLCHKKPQSYRVCYGICDHTGLLNRLVPLLVHCDTCKITMVYDSPTMYESQESEPRKPQTVKSKSQKPPKWARMRG